VDQFVLTREARRPGARQHPAGVADGHHHLPLVRCLPAASSMRGGASCRARSRVRSQLQSIGQGLSATPDHPGLELEALSKPSERTLLLSDTPFDPLRSPLLCSELQLEGGSVLPQLAMKTNEQVLCTALIPLQIAPRQLPQVGWSEICQHVALG